MPNRLVIKIKTFIPSASISDPFGNVFEGDNRGFSFDGSYRTAHYIKIDLNNLSIIENMPLTGTTVRLNSDGTKDYGKAGTDNI